MTHVSSPHNWEKEELKNPLGGAGWVLNPLTKVLTVLRTIKTPDRESAPWDSLRDAFKTAVFSEDNKSIRDCTFNGYYELCKVQISISVKSID